MDVIFSTIVGGMLALGGAALGPYFQRKHERWKAERDDQNVLRNKAQELFDELDRVVSESQLASQAAIARLQNDAVEIRPVPDLGRIRAIAAIYFSSSLPLIDGFEKEHQEVMIKIVEQATKAIDAGDKGLGVLKAAPMLMAVKYQEFAAKFVRDMRAHLASNVPRIEFK